MKEIFPSWIDVAEPTKKKLLALAKDQHLHLSSILDCLDPEHYPKIEKIGPHLFLILRFFDEKSSADCDDLLALTRKLAFFYKPELLITVHRGKPNFIDLIEHKLKEHPVPEQMTSESIMIRLMKLSIESYDPFLMGIESDIEKYEKALIQRKIHANDVVALYQIRSKISVVKRLMLHSLSVIREFLTIHNKEISPWLQDLKETAEKQYHYCDELMEDTQNILNLQISLSSQRTNEVMRFLTVVSLFFMPLTFIVGIYGMNFKFMPELEWKYGYLFVWVIMAAISGFIFYKVKKKGWLDRT